MMHYGSRKGPIETSVQEGVLRIGINRPDKKNALTAAMYQDLADTFREAGNDPQVRVVLLHGSKDCFTSGNDLQDFLQAPPTNCNSPVFSFLTALCEFEKPLVAAVNGFAVGIGTTLLLHCDLVYAGENARFQLPFINLGLCPEAASSLLLPRLVGHQKAAELLMLGEPFDARKGGEIGLVNAILPEEQLLSHAIARAQNLAEKPPEALRLTKSLLKTSPSRAVADVLATEAEQFLHLLKQPEAKEAITAFLEKRAPDFRQVR